MHIGNPGVRLHPWQGIRQVSRIFLVVLGDMILRLMYLHRLRYFANQRVEQEQKRLDARGEVLEWMLYSASRDIQPFCCQDENFCGTSREELQVSYIVAHNERTAHGPSSRVYERIKDTRSPYTHPSTVATFILPHPIDYCVVRALD